MEELNQLLQTEVDPLKDLDKVELRQRRGFLPEGVKSVTCINSHLLNIKEGGSGGDYFIEFLIFKRIVEACGFEKRSLEMTFSKLLNGITVLFFFDEKKVAMMENKVSTNFIGKHFKDASENYDPEAPEDEQSTAGSYSSWYNYISKD